jgi:hypothetical protein
LYASLLQTEFEGASGYVSFCNNTGSHKTVPFLVDNTLMVPKEGGYGLIQAPIAKVGLLQVQVLQDFIFWDNTTNAPIQLPLLEQDWNLILHLLCFYAVWQW